MLLYRKKILPYCILLLPLIFFAYQFVLRLWPGLMVEQIMSQYSISAAEFGILAAFYYYGYSGMQIPVAILLEKYGARYVIAISALLCSCASLIFIYSDNFYLALLSRLLIGAGSAAGFLGVSKVISEWFPQVLYSRMVGFSFSFGLLGAIYGGKPLNLLVNLYDWRQVAFFLAVLGGLIGIAVFWGVKSKSPQNPTLDSSTYSFQSCMNVLTSPTIWLLSLSNLLMVGALEGFADVWGVSYLKTAFQIDKSTAAGLLSFIFIGMLTGGPLLAFLSKKFGNYFIIFASGMCLGLLFLLLFTTHFYSWYFLAGLFFLIGNLCCYQVIVFDVGACLVSTQYLGFTVAFLNSANMLGGSLFHTLIGKAMNWFWSGAIDSNGLKIYELNTYKYALSIIPMFAVLGAMIIAVLGLRIFRVQKRNTRKINGIAAVNSNPKEAKSMN